MEQRCRSPASSLALFMLATDGTQLTKDSCRTHQVVSVLGFPLPFYQSDTLRLSTAMSPFVYAKVSTCGARLLAPLAPRGRALHLLAALTARCDVTCG